MEIISILISLLFLFASVYWNWKIYKSNKEFHQLSLKPALSIRSEIEDRKWILYLANVGLGPCRLDSAEFIYGKKPFKTLTEALEDKKDKGATNTIDEYKGLTQRQDIGKGQYLGKEGNESKLKMYIVNLNDQSDIKKETKNLNNIFKDIRIKLVYFDIYENKEEFEDKLVEFG